MSRTPSAPAPATTWRQLYEEAAATLVSEIDARRIVERAAGLEEGGWFLALDTPVAPRDLARHREMVRRRSGGEPLQYVLGRWGFRTLDLFVDRRALIPRPETEQVVEAAVQVAEAWGRHPLTVVDLGTGTGAIALSLAVELPMADVWATDVSEDALAVARANLTGIGTLAARRVQLRQGSWFAALPAALRGRIDLVVTNPPYVAAGEELPAEVADWEPRDALVGGPTGLEPAARILAEAPGWLARPAALVVEVAPHQAEPAARLATHAGFGAVEVRPDLAGRPRALVAHLQRS